jgi:hypothetical protein
MKAKFIIPLAVVVAVVGLAIYIRPNRAPLAPPLEQTSSLSTNRVVRPRLPAPRMPVTAPSVESTTDDWRSTNLIAQSQANAQQSSNLIARLLKGESPKLTREQIESYLAGNRRSADSLLAAFRTTRDRTFLQEAMEKFPNDPRVDFDAIFQGQTSSGVPLPPEERRQWLDAFKRAAPDNALANYLSAYDYFKSGQTDQAVQELLDASGKPSFQDYSLDFIQNAEEAYRAAGYPDAEAKATAETQLLLPQLNQLRQVGRDLVALANSYRQAGDEASAQAALQMGVTLGQRLEVDGSAGQFVINNLVGIAIQRIVLGAMNPTTSLDSAGHTAQDRLNELAQQRQSIQALDTQRDLLPTMSEQDLISYFDREKAFGEVEALRWLVGKYGQQ